MKNGKQHIAVAVALVVVGFAFFPSLFQMIEDPGNSSTPRPLSLELPNPFLSLPDFSNQNVADEAWATFEDYLDAARAHDLARLRSISHQISPACADPARIEECYGLMDSVVFFSEGLKQSDFTNSASDARQTVLSTNYMAIEGAEAPIKAVLYFTRGSSGEHKMLGLRFCFGDKDNEKDSCVETRESERDRDGNGWWDDVEALFR